jgi:HAD superfamily hydrolase (TIGR01490 family)
MPEEKYVAVVTKPVAAPQPGEAAFFDVDNTLMRGASLFHVARKMHQRGAFTLSQAAGFAWKQFKFVARGENMDDVHAVRDSALTLAAGITVDDIKALGEEVYDEMIASRIWPGAKALAEQHLRVGRRVWLVTATPIEVATVISTRLGLTGALGTVGEVSEGMYTGRLVGDILHGSAKAVAVQEIADAEDWTSSVAGPTATPTTTSLCSPLLATRWPSTRTPACGATPATITGPSMTSAQAGAQQPWASRQPPFVAPSTDSGKASPASAAHGYKNPPNHRLVRESEP